MNILSDLSWIQEEKIPDQVLFLSRNHETIKSQLEKICTESISLGYLGQKIHLNSFSSLEEEVRYLRLRYWNEESIETTELIDLEQRVQQNLELSIVVARIHALLSSEREIQGRQYLSSKEFPMNLLGELTPFHVELFAVGEKVLHVLHVDLLRKFSQLLLDSLEEDAKNIGFWLETVLDILPEKKLLRQIRKLTKKSKFQGGGIGLLAFYAFKMGHDGEPFLEKGNQYDRLLYFLASSRLKKIAP